MPAEMHHFINGNVVQGRSGCFAPLYNPATGEQTGQVDMANTEETRAAIDAAQQAFPAWAATTPLRRARIMFRFRDLLEQHADELVQLITREHGKVLSDARGELTRGIEVVEFVCGIPAITERRTFAERRLGASTAGRCSSRWVCAPVLRRSIFPPWCPCGCSRWPSPAAIASC